MDDAPRWVAPFLSFKLPNLCAIESRCVTLRSTPMRDASANYGLECPGKCLLPSYR